ncbi:LPO_1073/Vpar_1526 family protein [Zhenpiania hominis]|uniref:Uncharacterized protein n=1 Tax=Zhenpiania hominis TaxID=2763644 RepID=A0A923NJP5_9FIRM|nr:LPO_1073/Vpar_1526 family protein [Zhenpiania hominis]MBC6680328.1 hypothetical protein [Zhenpiania hominis]
MENSKQIQKAGEGSQQLQMINPTIVMGIDEKRVREVCSEMAIETIKQCTQEASAVAIARIEKFTTDLIPRVEKIESDYKSFSEPSFQFELRNAQKVAACTDREADYELLSELLVHRIEKGEERKIKASISKAIEIVDQIDDEALCALTIIYAINRWTAVTGDITQGLMVMEDLFSSICYHSLPKGLDWAYHLDILNAARVSSVGTFKKFSEFYPNAFSGYTCVGIEKESELYQSAVEILKGANIPINLLVDHELNDGYVRLNVRNKNEINNITFPVLTQANAIGLHKVIDSEVEALYKVWDLYSNDSKLKESVKQAFMQKWNTYDTLRTVRLWWEALPHSITITPIGNVLAHANAQRRNKKVPQIKL